MRTTLAALALLLSEAIAYDVISLTADNYDELTDGKTVFIKAFAPWCGHCKAMAPDWEKLAEEWHEHKVGLVAEIDCTVEEELCQKHNVEGFPTLFYGDPTALETYQQGRSYEDLAAFAKDNISKPVCSLKNFDLCDDEVKKMVGELRKKSVDDLKAMAKATLEKTDEINKNYFKFVEGLQEQYEKETLKMEESLAEARKEGNLSWVEKIVKEKGSDIEDIKKEVMGDPEEEDPEDGSNDEF